MSKRNTLLLYFIFSLFAALYVLLSFYSRLATDDYYFIADVRDHGVWGSFYSQYMAWGGRFSAIMLPDIIYKVLGLDQTWYFILPLFSFIKLIAGLYLLMNALCFQFNIVVDKATKISAAFLITILLFFMSVDIGESWFWYCSLSSYLWSIIALVIGLAFLFGNYNVFVSLSVSTICFIYVGGASEVYSVIYGVCFLVFLVYRYKQKDPFLGFINNALNKKVLFIYFILGISFLVFLIAPGNYLRDELFPKHEIANTLFITAKSIVKFGVLYLPFRVIYILAFAFPFYLIGKKIASGHSRFTMPLRIFFKRATLILTLLSLLFFLIVAFVMVETGPPRMWFLIGCMLTVYCCSICFYAGYKNYLGEKQTTILSTTSVLLGLLILGYNLIHQYPIAKKYAKANDERIEEIMVLKKENIHSNAVVNLAPLPPPGMLYSTEITSDTNHFTNRELKMGYDLQFHVVVNR